METTAPDFCAYKAAFDLLLQGVNFYQQAAYDAAEVAACGVAGGPFHYLPLLFFSLLPFLVLPFYIGFPVWQAFNFGIALASIFTRAKALALQWPREVFAAALLTVLSPSVLYALQLGQVSLFVVVMLLMAHHFLKRESYFYAGFFLGFFIIKPHIGWLYLLSVALLSPRKALPRILLGGVAHLGSATLTVLALGGTLPFRSFLEMHNDPLRWQAVSLVSIPKLFFPSLIAAPLSAHAALCLPLGVVLTLLLCRKLGRRLLSFEGAILMQILGLLLSPYVWIFDYSAVAFLAPAVLARSCPSRVRALFCVGSALALLEAIFYSATIGLLWYPLMGAVVSYLIISGTSDNDD